MAPICVKINASLYERKERGRHQSIKSSSRKWFIAILEIPCGLLGLSGVLTERTHSFAFYTHRMKYYMYKMLRKTSLCFYDAQTNAQAGDSIVEQQKQDMFTT